MSSLEELKDALRDTLAARGSLGQIQARVRAEIFNALEETVAACSVCPVVFLLPRAQACTKSLTSSSVVAPSGATPSRPRPSPRPSARARTPHTHANTHTRTHTQTHTHTTVHPPTPRIRAPWLSADARPTSGRPEAAPLTREPRTQRTYPRLPRVQPLQGTLTLNPTLETLNPKL
jgi:hypothetical protein